MINAGEYRGWDYFLDNDCEPPQYRIPQLMFSTEAEVKEFFDILAKVEKSPELTETLGLI